MLSEVVSVNRSIPPVPNPTAVSCSVAVPVGMNGSDTVGIPTITVGAVL